VLFEDAEFIFHVRLLRYKVFVGTLQGFVSGFKGFCVQKQQKTGAVPENVLQMGVSRLRSNMTKLAV